MKTITLLLFSLLVPVWNLWGQCVFKPLDESYIDHAYYSLSYNEIHEQADWVCYRLTKNMITGTAQRKNNFKADAKIRTGSAALADYKGSGYDRGHLAPAADFKFSQAAMDQSFYMSNMSPQNPSFNRGIWKNLEELMRAWAYEYGSIHIVTGPIFGSSETIGKNLVSVPSHYYKAILRLTDFGYEAIGFVLPNRSSDQVLDKYILSIDDLESIIQIDLFHELEDSKEFTTEALYTKDKWLWNYSIQNSTVIKEVTDRREKAIQCQGTTKSGARCKNKTLNGSGFCHLHDG